jgi:SAM-dependent methyltransferase
VHISLVQLLRCPRTGQRLELESPIHDGDRVRTGTLVTPDRAHRYPVREFIPRFVPESSYADNFGMQWNMFRETQLDSKSGHPISAERFWASTGWTAAALEGQWVLDCGCGAGRFAEVALSAGARVVALDYSSAADAAYANLKHHRNFHVVQGDIYALPFAPATFPFVYSFGVLQHTPDVEKAFAALPPMVAPGGNLCADFYEATWKHHLLPRHYLRPVTTRIDKTRLFGLCKKWVPRLLAVSQRLGRIPRIGRLLVRAIPVADYTGIYPLDQQQLREWALLDTFDWLSPAYDQPQRREIVAGWIEAGGFTRVDVVKAGFMVVRGIDKR